MKTSTARHGARIGATIDWASVLPDNWGYFISASCCVAQDLRNGGWRRSVPFSTRSVAVAVTVDLMVL